jgi:putative oligomerization/nucleic acid binding protein
MSDVSASGRAADDTGVATVPSTRTVLLYLTGIAGLAFSIALMFIEMRAVLDVGGSCADGGPYVSSQACPQGTWLMFLAIFGGFGWGALAFWAGQSIGGRYSVVPFLAWPALFCTLGFNFLQYGVAPPGGGGIELGFLIPGILFELMGGIPLALGLKWGSSGDTGRDRLRAAQLAAGLRVTGNARPSFGDVLADAPDSSTVADSEPDLAGEFERLADLHARGDLTDAEFAAAKAALLASTSDTASVS